MHVPHLAKRAVLTAAAACLVLTGCGDSGPSAPFNPTGTTGDLEAVNGTFESSAFASFSTFSAMFDAALLPAGPVVSASAAALDIRAKSKEGMRAAAVRSAQRVAALLKANSKAGLSASIAFLPTGVAGKTFTYSGGGYVMSDLPGAPANGVRFLLYAVDPVTFLPVEPAVETGHVDLTDLSSGATQAARVQVVSGGTEYINYRVSVTSSATSGRITIFGYVADGTTRADINLRATLTYSTGLTMTYGVDVQTRDFSIDLTMTSSGIDPTTATIGVTINVQGGNGWIHMVGNFDQAGAVLNVSVNGDPFATITVEGTNPPTITGREGQPLTDDDIAALEGIFTLTDGAFTSFDRLFLPVGAFLEPAA